jgi:ribosomal protein S18 acetylase RimI-like enzyme
MPELPPPSRELSRRLMRADVAYTTSRVQAIAARPGNPMNAQIRTLGDVTGFMVRWLAPFNRVVGLKQGDERLIEPFDRWYREHGIAARFEIAPGDHTLELGQELARCGYCQSAFQVSVYGLPAAGAPAENVIEVDSAERMEDFLDAHAAGWNLSQPGRDARANFRVWRELPGWRLFVGYADGAPAAAGILYLHDGVGYFADAATDPKFRGRGLQTSLLRARGAAAAAAGAELVYSQAEFASSSHRNMERVGMRTLHTRAHWTRLEPYGVKT